MVVLLQVPVTPVCSAFKGCSCLENAAAWDVGVAVARRAEGVVLSVC